MSADAPQTTPLRFIDEAVDVPAGCWVVLDDPRGLRPLSSFAGSKPDRDPFCAPWWEAGVDGSEIECPNCGSGTSSAPEMTAGGWRCQWCDDSEPPE